MPVRNRRPSVGAYPASSRGMAALQIAAARALTATSRWAESRSARFRMAERSAPTTKPIWTLIVSHDCSGPERPHSAVSCGTTAEAENQTEMAKSSAITRRLMVRHLPGREEVMGGDAIAGKGKDLNDVKDPKDSK